MLFRSSQGVNKVMERLTRTGKVEYNKKIKYNLVWGMPTDDSRTVLEESGLLDTQVGRKLKTGDKFKIIIGPELAKSTKFGKAININDKIKINEHEFTVVGIIKTGGNPGISSSIIMTLEDARVLFNEPNEISIMTAKIELGEDLDKVVSNIKKDLAKSRGVKTGKEDFTVQSAKKFVESFFVIFNVEILLCEQSMISILL